MVRAKFWVSNIESVWEGKATVVHLNAVYSGSEENDQFFEATPAGHIQMTIKNDVAAQMFEQGQEYYVDFTPVAVTEVPSAD